jgi:hypothetical protein
MKAPIGRISYHVRVLAEEELIEPVTTRSGRGKARVYDATTAATSNVFMLDEIAWHQLLDDRDALIATARELEVEAACRTLVNSGRARFAVTVATLTHRASTRARRGRLPIRDAADLSQAPGDAS